MTQVVISGSGLWTPEFSISNEELVDSYNQFADKFNAEHSAQIESGEIAAKPHSSAEFIYKASGIKSRYVYTKDGILDVDRMRPTIPERAEDELSNQAEIGVKAAKQALEAAGRKGSEVDAVIVSCAYTQRAYPAVAIEIQEALGVEGFGFDMLVACSAGTFALHRAWEMVKSGTARSVLVINPELVTPQLNFCDRDSHFIFGDVATAMLVEAADYSVSDNQYEILSTSAKTKYSSNIRSNFGYMSRANDVDAFGTDKLFHQEGRKVFKEVCPMAAEHILAHMGQHNLTANDVKRWWLHQANINMNMLIAKKILGRDANPTEAPVVLDRYANTASAGSLIAFNLHQEDMQPGDYGVLCSFGAGYSIGSLVVQKR
ncbi:beta-ketoacyl-ACP synthase III [Planctobacterium marinum]|uniref:Beta-ketoacyl-ACP synthase III n=1 Tax=Planctobacterium marinum TaxID=1631968 RepID=A0AA48KND2_9ALTE|nr:beta-ketoacyl-ACP synthase III [Planctobacterium marinum]